MSNLNLNVTQYIRMLNQNVTFSTREFSEPTELQILNRKNFTLVQEQVYYPRHLAVMKKHTIWSCTDNHNIYTHFLFSFMMHF